VVQDSSEHKVYRVEKVMLIFSFYVVTRIWYYPTQAIILTKSIVITKKHIGLRANMNKRATYKQAVRYTGWPKKVSHYQYFKKIVL